MIDRYYKKVWIIYDEEKNNWSCDSEGITEEASSLKEIKVKIDKALKKTFERISVWTISYWPDQYIHGKITSFVKEGNEKISQAWIVSDKGERSKESISQLLEDTEDNRKKIETIQSLEEKSERLQDEIKTLKDSFVTVDQRFSKDN